MAGVTADPWADYWQDLPDGHFLFPAEGREVAKNLAAAFPLAGLRVLDYGSGYGLVAREVAPRVGSLAVWDRSERVRRFAAGYLRDCPNVVAFDPAAGGGPFDLILVNSVVQYMTSAELGDLVSRAANWLAPDGRLVLSDLVPPGQSLTSDLASLIGFSLRHGYLLSALKRSYAARKPHADAASAAPMYRPTDAALTALANDTGLSLAWLPRNLTHFRGRRTAVLTKPGAAA